MMVAAVRPEVLDEHWNKLKVHFDNFAESSKGELTVDALKKMVDDGTRMCWVAVDGDIYAVALTEETVGGVWLDFCNGVERDKWGTEMVRMIKEYAKSRGKTLKVFCRPGWAPWLKKEFGFRETHRFLELETA